MRRHVLYTYFELDMECGVGDPPVLDPLLSLEARDAVGESSLVSAGKLGFSRCPDLLDSTSLATCGSATTTRGTGPNQRRHACFPCSRTFLQRSGARCRGTAAAGASTTPPCSSSLRSLARRRCGVPRRALQPPGTPPQPVQQTAGMPQERQGHRRPGSSMAHMAPRLRARRLLPEASPLTRAIELRNDGEIEWKMDLLWHGLCRRRLNRLIRHGWIR